MDLKLIRRCFIASMLMALTAVPAAADPEYELGRLREGVFYEFTTKRRPKAHGVVLKIPIPKSWLDLDTDTPHVAREFRSNAAGKIAIGGKLFVFEETRGQNLAAFLPRSPRHLQVTKTTVDGLPASIREYRFDVPADENDEAKYVRAMALSVQFENRHVALIFGVGAEQMRAQEIDNVFESYRPLFREIFSRVTIESSK
ncbi:MAG: hypothetical protein QM775_22915 [Pirellulales bacterium]